MMEKKMRKAVAPLLISLLFSIGCSGMSNTQQRVLSGGAVGATGGAIIGAVAGSAALGGAAGGGIKRQGDTTC